MTMTFVFDASEEEQAASYGASREVRGVRVLDELDGALLVSAPDEDRAVTFACIVLGYNTTDVGARQIARRRIHEE
jgi:prophage tail gpP-like protein